MGRDGKLTTSQIWLFFSREELIRAAEQKGGVRGFEMPFRVKSGAVRDIVLSAEVIDLGGQPHLLTVSVDVTERKLAEQALKESEQRFRVLSEAAFEGIAIVENGKILDASDRIAEMLECRREDLIGMPVAEFVAPKSRDLVAEKQRSGSEEPYEHLAQRVDGTVFPVQVTGRWMPYQGRTVRVAAVRDLTQDKQAEEALLESEAKYRDLVETSQDLIWRCDLEGRFTYVNPAWERTHGYKVEEMLVLWEAYARDNNVIIPSEVSGY